MEELSTILQRHAGRSFGAASSATAAVAPAAAPAAALLPVGRA